MIKKWKGYIAVFVVLVILVAALAASQMDLGGQEKPQVYQITVIYRGTSQDESQQALRQGMDQAGSELHAEITYVPVKAQGDAKEQAEIIRKEAEQGADAIVIEPLDDKTVKEELLAAAGQTPIVIINSDLEKTGTNLTAVHGDSSKLGSKLAEKMWGENIRKGKVMLLRAGFQYSDLQSKYKGMIAVLKQHQIPYEEVVVNGEEKEKEAILKDTFINAGAVQAVAFDSQLTELAGKVIKENPECRSMKMYGFGKTNQMISYLEDGYLQGLGVFNEYSIGYLGVENAVDMILGESMETKKISYAIIDKGNIYTTENQKLLFPFVQ